MNQGIKLYYRAVGIMGLVSAIKGRLTNSTGLLEVKRQDCKFPFWLRNPSSDIRAYEQVFIKNEYDFLVEKQPEVIVDAGANIGLASIFFANRYPSAKIVAIEPEQGNFELLKKNVAPYANIIPAQAALWHKNGEINLVDPGLGNWGFMTEDQDTQNKLAANMSHTVKAITVNKIMDDYKLDKIDIFKVDIEGAEREIFSDNLSWIEKIDSLIVELHERMKPGCNRSFYNGSNGFDNEWLQGENVYLSRGHYLTRRPT